VDAVDWLSHRNRCHVQLLKELALRGRRQRLASFELTTGKHPQAAVPLMRRSLTHQVTAVVHNDRGKDADAPGLGTAHETPAGRYEGRFSA
jgi:hypothetical protein